jgi:hypothetical protein
MASEVEVFRGGAIRHLTIDQLERKSGGLIRIGVDVTAAPLTWDDYRTRAEASPDALEGLKIGARERGADPSEWRASFDPAPRAAWLTVERWDRDERQWTPFYGPAELVNGVPVPAGGAWPLLKSDKPSHEAMLRVAWPMCALTDPLAEDMARHADVLVAYNPAARLTLIVRGEDHVSSAVASNDAQQLRVLVFLVTARVNLDVLRVIAAGDDDEEAQP